MSREVKKEKSKKMNSYIKMLLFMALGGVIGGVGGYVFIYYEDGVAGMMGALSGWITKRVLIIMVVLTLIVLILCILCYWKSGMIIRSMEGQEDDELQDRMDKKFDFWGTVGVMVSNIGMCLGMIFLAFSFKLDSKGAAGRMLYCAVLLIVCTAICGMYQVAMVKQIKQKDPMKRGEASDIHFQRDFLASCDEAERKVIYMASYKTFMLMKTMLMLAIVIAMIGHLIWQTGLIAVILLGICYGLMTVTYGIYTVRLQKCRLDL